jgi:hypothetical protein
MAANAGAGGPPGAPSVTKKSMSRTPAGAGTPVSAPDSGFIPVPDDLLHVDVNRELTMDQLRTLFPLVEKALAEEGDEMRKKELQKKLEAIRVLEIEKGAGSGSTKAGRRRVRGKSSNSTRTKRRRHNKKKTLKRRHNQK